MDELFTLVVAVGRIDEGDAGIEQAVKQFLNLLEGNAVADASCAKSMATYFEVGGSELCYFFQFKPL